MREILREVVAIVCYALLLAPSFLFAQAKGPRELRVPYPLGGSTSYFWVAYRTLAGMNLNGAEMLDLTFLERLAAERKAKQR